MEKIDLKNLLKYNYLWIVGIIFQLNSYGLSNLYKISAVLLLCVVKLYQGLYVLSMKLHCFAYKLIVQIIVVIF